MENDKIGERFEMNRQQMLEKVENLSAYEVKDHRFIEEMNSEGIVLEHRKSGSQTVPYEQ